MNLYLKDKAPINVDKYLYFLAFILLCFLAYYVGYASIADERSIRDMPVVMFDIMSERNGHRDLAVRRVPDGKLGYLEGTCYSDCPKFEVGERVTMERWKSKYGTPVFVYHADTIGKGTDQSYYEGGNDYGDPSSQL